MTDFATVKGFLQELQLAIVAEDPAEGIVVVEDEERGIKHLDVDCEDPMLIFTERILEVPTRPGALFRRLLQMNRTLVQGAFVLDEAGKSVLLHDTLALAHESASPRPAPWCWPPVRGLGEGPRLSAHSVAPILSDQKRHHA